MGRIRLGLAVLRFQRLAHAFLDVLVIRHAFSVSRREHPAGHKDGNTEKSCSQMSLKVSLPSGTRKA